MHGMASCQSPVPLSHLKRVLRGCHRLRRLGSGHDSDGWRELELATLDTRCKRSVASQVGLRVGNVAQRAPARVPHGCGDVTHETWTRDAADGSTHRLELRPLPVLRPLLWALLCALRCTLLCVLPTLREPERAPSATVVPGQHTACVPCSLSGVDGHISAPKDTQHPSIMHVPRFAGVLSMVRPGVAMPNTLFSLNASDACVLNMVHRHAVCRQNGSRSRTLLPTTCCNQIILCTSAGSEPWLSNTRKISPAVRCNSSCATARIEIR